MTNFNTNFLKTIPFSDSTVQIALAANTALTYTIPGDKSNQYRCEFSWPYNANVWVGYNSVATLPVAGSVTTSSNRSIELRPILRYVRGGDVLSFISSAIVTDSGFSLLEVPG